MDVVVLDLETTGLHPAHVDRIAEVGAVRYADRAGLLAAEAGRTAAVRPSETPDASPSQPGRHVSRTVRSHHVYLWKNNPEHDAAVE
jgi:DNA polymerase III epsilon subunit-like protein